MELYKYKYLKYKTKYLKKMSGGTMDSTISNVGSAIASNVMEHLIPSKLPKLPRIPRIPRISIGKAIGAVQDRISLNSERLANTIGAIQNDVATTINIAQNRAANIINEAENRAANIITSAQNRVANIGTIVSNPKK